MGIMVKNYRMMKGLTLEELSALCGVEVSVMGNLESMKLDSISTGTVARIAKGLGVSVNALFMA